MEKLLTIINGPRLTSCRFDKKPVKDKKTGESIPVQCTAEGSVVINTEKMEVLLKLSVESNTPGIPFSFYVEMDALYKTLKNAPRHELEEAGKIEIGAALFALIRDFVAELTRKGGGKPFWMTYVDFNKAKEFATKNLTKSPEKRNIQKK